MVPMVKSGGGDQPSQRTQFPAYVGMDEETPHCEHQHEQGRHCATRRRQRRGDPKDVDRYQPAQPGKNIIDRMGARADEEI